MKHRIREEDLDTSAIYVFYDERSKEEIEQIVIATRLYRYTRGLTYGAKAIREQLEEELTRPLPSISTINRILSDNNMTNGRTGYYPEAYFRIR